MKPDCEAIEFRGTLYSKGNDTRLDNVKGVGVSAEPKVVMEVDDPTGDDVAVDAPHGAPGQIDLVDRLRLEAILDRHKAVRISPNVIWTPMSEDRSIASAWPAVIGLWVQHNRVFAPDKDDQRCLRDIPEYRDGRVRYFHESKPWPQLQRFGILSSMGGIDEDEEETDVSTSGSCCEEDEG